MFFNYPMAQLAKLKNWKNTKNALHQSMQVLRSTRLLQADPLPNGLHYASFIRPFGATTGPLKFGGELKINFPKLAVIYEKDGSEIFSVGLSGHNLISLFDEVFSRFKRVGLKLNPERKKVTSSEQFKLNSGHAKAYAQIQFRVYTALARLKAHLLGTQTPVVLWPHGFDLSFIWFARGINERKDPHMNFGFSPGDKSIPRPYLYFYAWPAPKGLLKKKLPANGRWVEVWRTPGAVFDLDAFAKESDPEEAITQTLLSCFWDISPLLQAKNRLLAA